MTRLPATAMHRTTGSLRPASKLPRTVRIRETDEIVSHDAIVVGGGHNGLTAAAYLARAGLDVCVLERRDVLGGACVTEEVWPGYRVSRASYVVSMLQPKVVADLRLREHGYEPIPLDPPYATFASGTPVFFHDDPAAARASIARVSPRDADAYPAFMAMIERAAAFVRPLLLKPPPALGSRHPADLPGQLAWLGRAAGLPRAGVRELYRLMTMSVGDLLDEWFGDDALKGCLASTGVVGVWAGPRTPGTAYNLLHHALGSLDGAGGAWGHVRGGMGAISLALAASATASGATVRTEAPVASIDVSGGAVTGVTLQSGETLRAPLVVSGAHPQTTVLDLAGAEHFPDEVVAALRRYRTRGGSVKVNLVLERPPAYAGVDPREQAALERTGLALCPSVDHLERAWHETAVLGRPAAVPYIEVEVPSSVDRTLADGPGCIATMFTQYGPPTEDGWPDGARERYLDACLGVLEAVAPGVRETVVHAEVLAPPDLERIFGLRGGSIFHGEQDLAQMAFMRPTADLARYATPVRGLYLCGAGTHPGGGVIGASGHNAAMRVLADRRRAALRRRAGALRPRLR
jgi:phytoene dehydrogenase-like protein